MFPRSLTFGVPEVLEPFLRHQEGSRTVVVDRMVNLIARADKAGRSRRCFQEHDVQGASER